VKIGYQEQDCRGGRTAPPEDRPTGGRAVPRRGRRV